MSTAVELLATAGSELGAQLRYGLTGLRAALAAALQEHPDDPGAAACARYLAELDELVAPAPVTRRVEPVASAAAGAALLDHPAAPPWLRAADGPDAWRRYHVAALRLAAPDAQRWLAAVTEALGAPASDGSWHSLPGDEDLVLVPPLPGSAGWRAAVNAPADRDVRERLRVDAAPADPHRAELARLASTVLAMTELDDDLWFGLESVRFRGLGRLDDATRTAYHRDLLDRLAGYGSARYGTPESFRALLLVDEALHAVLHLPRSAPGSWWSRLLNRSRDLVFAAQRDHQGVDVQLLARPYRETKALTGGNDVRHPLDGSGAVLACLRLWATVAGTELPGRVVYAG